MTRPAVRPVAAGYVRVPDDLDAGDEARLVRRWGDTLNEFADHRGYALGALFADVSGRGEPGLYDLVRYVQQGRAAAVVVPDLRTLTRSGCLVGADRLTAARFLRAPVLSADPADPTGTAAVPGPGRSEGAEGASTGQSERADGGQCPEGEPEGSDRHSAQAELFAGADGAGAPAGRHVRTWGPGHPRRRRTDREWW